MDCMLAVRGWQYRVQSLGLRRSSVACASGTVQYARSATPAHVAQHWFV